MRAKPMSSRSRPSESCGATGSEMTAAPLARTESSMISAPSIEARRIVQAGASSASSGSCSIHLGSRVASHELMSVGSMATAHSSSAGRILVIAATRACSNASPRATGSSGSPARATGGSAARNSAANITTARAPTTLITMSTREEREERGLAGEPLARSALTRIALPPACRSVRRNRRSLRGRCRPWLRAPCWAHSRGQGRGRACCS